MTVAERFNKRWRLDASGCWLWDRPNKGHGYGDLRTNGKLSYSHRVSYELYCGPIPAGMHVLHRCDVRACVNPEHLFLGTNLDNIIDSMSKGRRKGVARPNKTKGQKHRPMKLLSKFLRDKSLPPEHQVLIRRQVARGRSYRSLADLYQVGYIPIFNAVHHR